MDQQDQNTETEDQEVEQEQQIEEPTETDEDAFSKLFEERQEAEDEPETDDEAGDEPEPAGDDEGQPDNQPEPESAQDEPERPPETGSSGEPEWFQALPEDVQSKLTEQTQYTQHLYQSYTALMGRVPGLQRENADLKKQLESLQKQLGDITQAPTPTLEDLEKSDAFKEYAADFPNEAKELKEKFTSQARAAEQAKRDAQQAQQAVQDQRRQLIQVQTQRLAAKHPDWMQVRNSPMFEQWKSAILANPHQYPEMANKLSSIWAEDNVDVINQFKKDLAEVQGQGQQPPAEQPKPNPKPTRRPKPPSPSPAPQGSGVSGNRRSNAPVSDEDLFDQMVKQGT